MEIQASAPGKLVLCGEYAALEGAPALVLAVDARARASLRDADDGEYRVSAPDMGVTNARLDVDAHGMRWKDLRDAQRERMSLVARVIEKFGAGQNPFAVALDTREFSTNGQKLGLGSSAAITVALAGALCERAGREPPRVADLIALHRDWQGSGSGVDVAASCNGGLCIYTFANAQPSVERTPWPASLHACFVWSGESVGTGLQLQKLVAWRTRAPFSYMRVMRGLSEAAEHASATLRDQDAGALLRAIGAFSQRLRALNDSAGLEINGLGHRALAARASQCGVVYKSCGAGGDIGVAMSCDVESLNRFRREFKAAGFREIALKLADCGLQASRRSHPHATQPRNGHAGRYLAAAH